MRNHKFAEQVVQSMLTYNNNFYIDDIYVLINNNTYGDEISVHLRTIISILNNITNTNVNTNITANIQSLKMTVFRILSMNNGVDVLKHLICEDLL
jgi:hypothetical protein